MIPIRDINPSRLVPFVNYLIIGVCLLVFFYEITLDGYSLKTLIMHYGIVPAHYSHVGILAHSVRRDGLLPLFTSMFLHGGWLHVIGNMWVLFIFGDNVESALGHARYLLFYVLSGLIAGFAQIAASPGSNLPTIGASGAIAGVMGAYLVLYPRARILTFIPIFFFFYLMEIPAYVFLGLWFLLQFLRGTSSLLNTTQHIAGIAWWAHIGGFAGGILMLYLLGRARSKFDGPRSFGERS